MQIPIRAQQWSATTKSCESFGRQFVFYPTTKSLTSRDGALVDITDVLFLVSPGLADFGGAAEDLHTCPCCPMALGGHCEHEQAAHAFLRPMEVPNLAVPGAARRVGRPGKYELPTSDQQLRDPRCMPGIANTSNCDLPVGAVAPRSRCILQQLAPRCMTTCRGLGERQDQHMHASKGCLPCVD